MDDGEQARRWDDRERIERAQRVRLKRLGLANIAYAIFTTITGYLIVVGQVRISITFFAILLGLISAVNIGFALLIYSGLNRRFSDPSMTVIQILVVLAVQLLFFSLSRTIFAQDIYLIGFIIALLFGALQLGWRQMAVLTITAFTGFILLMLWNGAGQHHLYGHTAARAGIYGMLLAWITFFASYVGRLRSHLRERNVQLHRAMERIEELAIQDELTGAYNRRFIRHELEQEVERANRAGTPFSICMIDIDHFKQFNDMFGHLIGDAVLRELVSRIQHCIRRLDHLGNIPVCDQVGRFGGEEFLLVLPLTHLEGARLCAERIRKQVSETMFDTDAGELEVTLSAGVAEYVPGQTIEMLVDRADQALYRAKASGRNCVIADEPNRPGDLEAR